MLNDGLKLTGKLKIALNGETVQEVNNLVVTDGKEYVASRMKDATATAMSHMAIGSGSTAPLIIISKVNHFTNSLVKTTTTSSIFSMVS